MGDVPHNPGVEPENVNSATLFRVIGVSTLVVVVLVVIGFNMSMREFKVIQAEVMETTGYPTLHETEVQGASLLSGYEQNDDGTYRIPIERAMELEVRDAQ